MGEAMIDQYIRFQKKFVRIPESGCWIWMGGTNENGYGIFGVGTRKQGVIKAHRFSWAHKNGLIPEGAKILHECGVEACVNPDHLYAGTMKQNTADTIRMGRLKLPDNRGQKAKWSKLTNDDVLFIRSCKGLKKGTGIELAKKFNVSKSAIYNIWSDLSWKSVK